MQKVFNIYAELKTLFTFFLCQHYDEQDEHDFVS